MMFIVMYIQLLIASIDFTKSLPAFYKCWKVNETNIGSYRNILYQLVFVNEQRSIELQCKNCSGPNPYDVNIYWTKFDVSPISNSSVLPQLLNENLKALHNDMKIVDNNSLFIKKIKTKHSGVYSCYLNASSLDYETDFTTSYQTFAYYVHVYSDKNQLVLTGTYSEWNYYVDFVYGNAQRDMDSIDVVNKTLNKTVKSLLTVQWDDWGHCLCGKHKYDTRSYRNGYCCVKTLEGLVLPCRSFALSNFYRVIAEIVERISDFKEYRRCIEDCVPAVLEEEVDFKFQETLYLREFSHRELICPESENSTDVIWIRNDNLILNKTKNALGVQTKELNVRVDTYNTLYLTDVTKREEGYYSCVVDGIPIIKILVRIEPSNVIFTKECAQKLKILTFIIGVLLILFSCLECYSTMALILNL